MPEQHSLEAKLTNGRASMATLTLFGSRHE